jgi:hypothetical protein
VRTYSIAALSSRYDSSGSLPLITLVLIPNALPRSAMRCSPCCVAAGVEMPQPLLVTIMSRGSSMPGRVLQMRHVAKSPSAEPASPPCTIVMPLLLARFCASAVPGAIENCTSMGDEIGTTFQALIV